MLASYAARLFFQQVTGTMGTHSVVARPASGARFGKVVVRP